MSLNSLEYFIYPQKTLPYRKFKLDDPGVKMTNLDFSHRGNIRDVLLENYIQKLKFPKITAYSGYNTKYLHGGKS